VTRGHSGAGFDLDLLEGQRREAALWNLLIDATVEVKSDKKQRETGNVFIEFRQHGRPSGLAVSTARWWAIEFYPDCWVLLPRQRLRLIAIRAYRTFGPRKGGDFDEFEGVIIPVGWLVAGIHVVDGGS
jgi:hypothetical protein